MFLHRMLGNIRMSSGRDLQGGIRHSSWRSREYWVPLDCGGGKDVGVGKKERKR